MSLQREVPGASQRRVQGTLAGYIYLPSIKTTVIVYVDIIKLIFIFYLSSCLIQSLDQSGKIKSKDYIYYAFQFQSMQKFPAYFMNFSE